jgi:hypothetical protein
MLHTETVNHTRVWAYTVGQVTIVARPDKGSPWAAGRHVYWWDVRVGREETGLVHRSDVCRVIEMVERIAGRKVTGHRDFRLMIDKERKGWKSGM